MHGEVLDWLGTVRAALPALFRGRRVLECGSYDVNGSARSLFEDCEYVGLDWRPGPGVDVVGRATDFGNGWNGWRRPEPDPTANRG